MATTYQDVIVDDAPRKDKHVTVMDNSDNTPEAPNVEKPRDRRVSALRRMRSGSQHSEGSFDADTGTSGFWFYGRGFKVSGKLTSLFTVTSRGHI